MHTFEKKIAENIKRHDLLSADRPVVVAVSGGADSMALMTALCALGYKCIAAHCNFHLRGDESDRDMDHVEMITQLLDVEFLAKHFDVSRRMADTGESIEMACRDLRYQWFSELVRDGAGQAVAVAHNRGDNIETFFLNLLRTTGIAGLTAIEYKRGEIVRPMLNITRDEIVSYLADKDIPYIIDSTNNENVFKRNRLRNIILPMLEREFPGAMDAISATISRLSDDRRLIEYGVEQARAKLVEHDGESESMDLSRLLEAYPDDASRILLYQLLKPNGFNMTHATNIITAARTGSSGLEFTSTTHRATLSRGVLTVRPLSSVKESSAETVVTLSEDILSPIHITVEQHDIADFHPEKDANVIYLDASILNEPHRFAIRHWRRGDRLAPFGMSGTKLVSDIFNDLKLATDLKRSTLILTCDDQILWVIGARASRLFPVTASTTRFITLRTK